MKENLYLITGDDSFEVKKQIEKIKSQFGALQKGINFAMIDKDTIHTLDSELSTFAFGCDKKLIIVSMDPKKRRPKEEQEDAEQIEEEINTSDWWNEDLEETILNSLDTNVVVIVGGFASNTKLYKFVSKHGTICAFQKDKKESVSSWIVQRFKDENKKISSYDADYMSMICGKDKMMLSQEIEKVICYVGDKAEVTKKDLSTICFRTAETIVFDIVDYITNKNSTEVLKCLDELVTQKEPLQKILIIIANNFIRLLQVKWCVKQKVNVANTLPPNQKWLANKLQTQANKFSQKELEDIIIDLSKLDIASKTQEISDIRVGLEVCLLKFA